MRWARVAVVGMLLSCPACAGSPPSAGASSPSATYVPWLALKTTGVIPQAPRPSPYPPVSIPSGTPGCTADELEAAYFGGGGATGHTDFSFAFRNRSTSQCFLGGYPDVKVLDGSGAVMNQALGAPQRGTFFDTAGWDEPILLATGTPSLPSVVQSQQSVKGQAALNLEWVDCKFSTASRMEFDLPGGGGRLLVDFPVKASYSAACDGGTVAPYVLRGHFWPTGMEWPPGPIYIQAHVAINVPSSVKHGSMLVYFVTVTNTSSMDYSLTQCPDYTEILGTKQAVGQYQLNCAPVHHIAPGATVKFEMRLQVPDTMPAGAARLEWALADARVGVASANTTVTIS